MRQGSGSDGSDGGREVTEESGDDSSSGSTSASDDEDDSERVSSVPETPLQKPVTSAPQKNLAPVANPNDTNKKPQTKPLNGNPAVNQKSKISKSQTTELKNEPLKSMRSFYLEFKQFRNDVDSLLGFLADANVKDNQLYFANMLTWSAELV